MTKQEFEKQFIKDMGIVDGMINGVRVQYEIAEMTTSSGYSTWKREGTGRYQIKIYTPWVGSRGPRHQIFRTSKKDNSYRVDEARETIEYQATYYNQQRSRENQMRSNEQLARDLRDKFDKKIPLSTYKPASHTCSYVSPNGCADGKLDVLINFGTVSAEQAERILAFAQQIKLENTNAQ